MDRVGRFSLLFALILAAVALVIAAVGSRRRDAAWTEAARRLSYPLFAAVLAANAAMLTALLSNNFAIRYVADNSSRETPVFFKVLSLWAADDGSLLLWNLILAGYVVAVAIRFRRHQVPTFAPALAVLYAVACFYLALVSGPVRPFATLAVAPPDGRGPEPLLQNHPLMAVHPPFLYLGYIGFTVPFAFGVAALITGASSDRWVSIIRRWTLVVWMFLTVGLLLGALWSYQVLGWGGYWAWDPVENVALLPWLVATAFLHSVMLQERRGIARTWNVTLVIGAYALVTFGTFLTRGSILSSVHTFANSGLGPAYLAFLAAILLSGFGLAAWRFPQLRAEARIESLASREAAFVGNNVLLLVVTGIVLIGTVFPLFVEALNGRQVTVGAPYFQHATAPALALLLVLAGAGPRLPWRGGSLTGAAIRLRLPVAVAAVAVLGLSIAGLRHPAAIAGLGLAAFTFSANLTELIRGVAAGRHRGTVGTRTALLRGRRRYGGLTVHLGLAVAAAGIIVSSSFAMQAEVTLNRGQSTHFAGYVWHYDALRTDRQPQRVVLTTDLTVSKEGVGPASAFHLRPALNLYPAASEPIGSPAIRHGVVSDLYVSVIGLQQTGRSATLRLFRNPGVNWLWAGGGVMALGGLVAAWPPRRRRPAGPSSAEPSTAAGRDLAAAGQP